MKFPYPSKFIKKFFRFLITIFQIEVRIIRGDRRTWYLYVKKYLDYFQMCMEKFSISNISIDVIIPVAIKDFYALDAVVNSIRKYIMHPINKLFIISQKNEVIETFCKNNNCIWVDEDNVLPIKKNNIKYQVDGIDRAGWLFQQFLKLSSDLISKSEYILLIDSDTILIKPHQFVDDKENMTLFYSDEYHQPYYDIYKILLGRDKLSTVSFISHYMIVDRNILQLLKEKIESGRDEKWYEIILQNINYNESSAFSEYELYGNFLYENYRERMKIKYWFNYRISNKISDFTITNYINRNYRSVSFHVYYEKVKI